MLNNILQIGGDTFPGETSGINEGEFANEKVLEKLQKVLFRLLQANTSSP